MFVRIKLWKIESLVGDLPNGINDIDSKKSLQIQVAHSNPIKRLTACVGVRVCEREIERERERERELEKKIERESM